MFLQYLEKSIGGRGEVIFLPVDKHKSFLQDDYINLGVCSQACQKYPKQQVCNTVQYLKENGKDEVDFFACR